PNVSQLTSRLAKVASNTTKLELRYPEDAYIIDDANRPRVNIAGGMLHRAVDQLDELLEALRTPALYQRGNAIVRIINYTPPVVSTGIDRPRGSVIIQSADAHYVTDIGTRLARFVIPSANSAPRSVNCPDKLAKTYLARSEWNVPR